MITEFMKSYGMEIIAMVLVSVLGYLGMIAKRLNNRYMDIGDKKVLALTSVRYVEQVCRQLDGPEKTRRALNRFEVLLAEHNIICSATAMETLLESTVDEMNSQAGAQILGIAEAVEVTE